MKANILLIIIVFLSSSIYAQDVRPDKKAKKVFITGGFTIMEISKQFAINDLDIERVDTLVGQIIGSYSGTSLANNKVFIKAQRIDSVFVLSGKIDFQGGGFMINGRDIPDMEVVYGGRGTILREAFDKMIQIAKGLNPASITYDRVSK